MHRLVRTQPEPRALKRAREEGLPDWEHFPSKDKKSVRDALLKMQDYRCAYCERRVENKSSEFENRWDGHIEHFRKKAAGFFPELTFCWDNLFYSCMSRTSCGHYKDTCGLTREEHDLLIDPCKDDPEKFLVFDDKGRVSPRTNLSDEDRIRAVTTIEAFGLNSPQLVLDRKNLIDSFAWLKNYPPGQIRKYLDVIKDTPFITTIHTFMGVK